MSKSTDKNISIVIENHFFSHNKGKKNDENEKKTRKKLPELQMKASPFETEPSFLSEMRTKMKESNLYGLTMRPQPLSQNFNGSAPYQNIMSNLQQNQNQNQYQFVEDDISEDYHDASVIPEPEEQEEEGGEEEEEEEEEGGGGGEGGEGENIPVGMPVQQIEVQPEDPAILGFLIANNLIQDPKTLGFVMKKESSFPQRKKLEAKEWFAKYHGLHKKYKNGDFDGI